MIDQVERVGTQPMRGSASLPTITLSEKRRSLPEYVREGINSG